MSLLKFFNLNYPINDFFIFTYKLNIFFFIFFIFFIFIFLNMFFILIFYNFYLKNNKYFFIRNFLFEFIWIFLPFYLIMFIFFVSIFIFLKYKNIFNVYLNIKIISYQWKWYFNYLNNLNFNINYFSIISTCLFKIFNIFNIFDLFYLQNVNNRLVLPVNKNIRFLFISNDVIHSLYIPSLGFKQDSIPGFLRDFCLKSNKMGIYKGFCTELCGRNHSYMPFVLNFLNFYCYKKWTKSIFIKKFIILNY